LSGTLSSITSGATAIGAAAGLAGGILGLAGGLLGAALSGDNDEDENNDNVVDKVRAAMDARFYKKNLVDLNIQNAVNPINNILTA